MNAQELVEKRLEQVKPSACGYCNSVNFQYNSKEGILRQTGQQFVFNNDHLEANSRRLAIISLQNEIEVIIELLSAEDYTAVSVLKLPQITLREKAIEILKTK